MLFGPAVQRYTATHSIESGLEAGRLIDIGDDCWLGAGSVVTKDIPADVFAAGNPCRVIRRIVNY